MLFLIFTFWTFVLNTLSLGAGSGGRAPAGMTTIGRAGGAPQPPGGGGAIMNQRQRAAAGNRMTRLRDAFKAGGKRRPSEKQVGKMIRDRMARGTYGEGGSRHRGQQAQSAARARLRAAGPNVRALGPRGGRITDAQAERNKKRRQNQ